MTYRAGDMYADLHKRERRPESSWMWTLVSPTTQLKPTFDPEARGEREPAWNAIYGPGKTAGRPTKISERRLKKMFRMGNVSEMPFTVKFPKHRKAVAAE